jgi:hypothetical protein
MSKRFSTGSKEDKKRERKEREAEKEKLGKEIDLVTCCPPSSSIKNP